MILPVPPAVTVATNNDKTGYSLSSPQTFNLTGSITGNLSGSVGSVTGTVGSVTGNVGGNVVGSVGSVTGAVGSVTAGVTLATNAITTGSIHAGAITDAAFTIPALSNSVNGGKASGIIGMIFQTWRRLLRGSKNDKALGTLTTFADDGTTPVTVQNYTSTDASETVASA